MMYKNIVARQTIRDGDSTISLSGLIELGYDAAGKRKLDEPIGGGEYALGDDSRKPWGVRSDVVESAAHRTTPVESRSPAFRESARLGRALT